MLIRSPSYVWILPETSIIVIGETLPDTPCSDPDTAQLKRVFKEVITWIKQQLSQVGTRAVKINE